MFRFRNVSLNVAIVLLAMLLYNSKSSWIDRLFISRALVPSLPGSAVLVTGTSSGLGRHLSLYLASEGFVVFSTVRKEVDADVIAKEWGSRPFEEKSAGGALVPIIMDVTSDESVKRARRQMEAYLETDEKLKFVGIVNNAGVHVNGPMRSVNVSDFQRNFEVNIFGLVRVTQEFLPMFLLNSNDGRSGRVVNIGSVAGRITAPGSSPYSATKHALEAVTDSWRPELAQENISVSLIQPGFLPSKICRNSKICNDEFGLHEFAASVHHALVSPYPRTRYPVGWMLFTPSWVALWLHPLFSDRINDAMKAMIMQLTNGTNYWMEV